MLGAPGLDFETWESTISKYKIMRSETWVSDRLILYRLRAPSFRLFSGERVGNDEPEKNEFVRSET